MKIIKKIAAIVMVAAVAVTAGWNFYQNTQEVAMNELGLANVEALASGENGYSCTATVDCGFPLYGSVSCTGSVCSRGLDWSNGSYVECDGNRTYC